MPEAAPYFAYGSNLLIAQMRARCPGARPAGRAHLPGHRLAFVQPHAGWGGGVAGVLPAPGDAVHGALYLLPEAELRLLDGFEPVAERLYQRTLMGVRREDGTRLDAWVYVGVEVLGGPFRPSARYLGTMLEGAREHGLDAAWIEWLAAHGGPCTGAAVDPG